MSPAHDEAPDDQLLVRYLIGSATEAETERIDELSVTDDEIAWRVNEVENDLVDAYARRDLSGETLDRFKAHYLSSSKRREKVAFAEALNRHQQRAGSPAPAPSPPRAPGPQPRGGLAAWRHRGGARWPRWEWAAAALVVLAAAVYLVADNLRLRSAVNSSETTRAALEARERQLQSQLDGQRSANAAAADELSRVRQSLGELQARTSANPQNPSAGGIATLAVMLEAPTRGAELRTIVVPRATQAVTLRLQLDLDDFPRYRVAVEDPGSGGTLWQSAVLTAASLGTARLVSVTVPAHLIPPKSYVAQLSGIPDAGSPQLVSNYPFRVLAP